MSRICELCSGTGRKKSYNIDFVPCYACCETEVMQEKKNDLSGVNVGDKLYHVRYGWCEVVAIEMGLRDPLRVQVSNYTKSFTLEGYEEKDDALPTLFLSKPTIIYPPPPVEVEVKGWINLYVYNKEGVLAGTELYATKEEAIMGRDCRCVGEPIYICHKYREAKDE